MSAAALPADLSGRFDLIIEALCRTIAASRLQRLVPLWGWLHRLSRRLAALAARPRPPAPRRAARPRASRPAAPNRLPQGFGWLLRLVQQTACHGTQLEYMLLNDPDMAALLKAAPQAARLLRPLCRMLAIRPGPGIIPPLPPRPARTKPARAKPAEAGAAGGAPPGAAPPDLPPARSEPLYRRPRGPAPPGTVWRRWRGIWMPEPVRPPIPA